MPCFFFVDDVKIMGAGNRAEIATDLSRILAQAHNLNMSIIANKSQLLTKTSERIIITEEWGYSGESDQGDKNRWSSNDRSS